LLIELKQVDEALDCLRKAAASPQGGFSALDWRSRGDNLLWIDIKAAGYCFNQALEMDPRDAMAHMGKARVLEREGQSKAAIESFDRAIDLNPEDYLAYFEKANLLYGQKNFEEALRNYTRAIEFEPNYIYSWCNIGLCHDALGNYQEAFEAYSKTIDLDKDYAWAWEQRAGVLDKLNRQGEAIRNYRQALLLEEDRFWSNNNLGYLLTVHGADYEAALRHFDKAMELNPLEALPYANKANALADMGQAEDALELLTDALETVDDKGTIYQGLASLTFENFHQPEKSLQYYEEIERQGYSAFMGDLCIAEIKLSLEDLEPAKRHLAKWRKETTHPEPVYLCIAAFYDFAICLIGSDLDHSAPLFDKFIQRYQECAALQSPPVSDRQWRVNGFCAQIGKAKMNKFSLFALDLCIDLQRGQLSAPSLENMGLDLSSAAQTQDLYFSQFQSRVSDGVGKVVDWFKTKFQDD